MKKAGWQNWINLLLGIALLTVPWLSPHNLAPSDMTLIKWNFWIIGGLVIISSGSALRDLTTWEEGLNLALGVWLFISPWVFGYAKESTLMLNSIIIGLAIAVLSAMALPVAQRLRPPQHD